MCFEENIGGKLSLPQDMYFVSVFNEAYILFSSDTANVDYRFSLCEL